MAEATPPAATSPDPATILRSRGFVRLLVLAAVVGVVVSLAGWLFLEAVHDVQVWLYTDLPDGLGFDSVPTWWPIPVCALAGLPVAFAVTKLPGAGGHVPAEGLQVGQTQPNMVPGVVLAALAALATLGLGIVLGPEAPFIGIGTGVALFTVQLAKRDAPPTLLLVIGGAGALAAISVLFGSPVVAAVLIIEASGLGGATLPLILIPGLIAAGVGSLVFIGMANWTGLSTTAYSLPTLHLAPIGNPTVGEILWTLALGMTTALVTYPIRQLGLRVSALVRSQRPVLVVCTAGLLVGVCAFGFAQLTSESPNLVLFSGQDALPGLVTNAGTLSVGTLIFLVLFKGAAWGLSLGSFRGGPTFPAMFIGAAGGIAVAHLPGLPTSAGIAVGMGVMIVAFLRLPLSAIVIASALSAPAGVGVDPLIIVGVVTAYLATLGLEGRLGASSEEPAVDPTESTS